SRRLGGVDRCRFGQATFSGTHGNEREAPKPAVPGTVGRPKRSRWFAALVAAVARYTRYRVLDQCETIETRIPQTSTEDLSRFNRRFWRDERRDRASHRRCETASHRGCHDPETCRAANAASQLRPSKKRLGFSAAASISSRHRALTLI